MWFLVQSLFLISPHQESRVSLKIFSMFSSWNPMIGNPVRILIKISRNSWGRYLPYWGMQISPCTPKPQPSSSHLSNSSSSIATTRRSNLKCKSRKSNRVFLMLCKPNSCSKTKIKWASSRTWLKIIANRWRRSWMIMTSSQLSTKTCKSFTKNSRRPTWKHTMISRHKLQTSSSVFMSRVSKSTRWPKAICWGKPRMNATPSLLKLSIRWAKSTLRKSRARWKTWCSRGWTMARGAWPLLMSNPCLQRSQVLRMKSMFLHHLFKA